MNILYIDHYAGSPEFGMEYRPFYLSREWVKMGHKVTIIAADFSHLRKTNPVIYKDFQTQTIEGVDYVWIKAGEYRGNGTQRALSMGRFVYKLLKNARYISNEYKPDVVIASSTYPLDAYPSTRIASIAHAQYIHEVHDLWPATLYEVGGMSKHHPFVIAMQIAENYAYEHCDKCVALMPYAKEYMVKHGLRPDKFLNIQNGVVEDEWLHSEKIPKLHEEFFREHNNEFIVGYFGGHAVSNALGNGLDIAKRILSIDKSIIFVFVGEGVEKEQLIKRTKEENISNAFFLPGVNKKAIPDLLQHFDCSYMTGAKSPLYRFGLSLNKMYDSMMAGLPIICAYDAPDTPIKFYECGYQCNPEDYDIIINCIRQLKEMPIDERKKMGDKGKQAVLEHFTYDILAKQFADLF